MQRDGLFACANSGDTELWPAQYRLGLVEGLFLSEDGQLSVSPNLPKYGVHALNAVGVDASSARELLIRIEAAPLGLELTQNRAGRTSGASDLLNAAESCPIPQLRTAWTRIGKRLTGVGIN